MDCCPNERSQLDCATTWIQASEPTTDYIHFCDYFGWDDFPPPLPFPDGQGIMGFRDGRVRNSTNSPEPYWKEYAGACLLSPLRKDSVYRFQFDVGFVNSQKSPPIDISFFGTTDCEYLPFGIDNPDFGCPAKSPNWKKLGEVHVSGGGNHVWVNTSLTVIPEEDIYAIAIGPDCDPVSSPISIYYFFDNLLLADFESFNLQIKENQHPCSNDFTLSVPFNSDFDYQWYLSGNALPGETYSKLKQNYGPGLYQVRILDDESCRVSAIFDYSIPEFSETKKIAICQGDVYDFGALQLSDAGVYIDTFKTQDNCNNIVTLELEVIGAKYDTIEVSILEGETYEVENNTFSKEGDYPITLESSLGCDSLVLLKLTNFGVYIPNIFSPNQDGVNDLFFPISHPGNIISVDMSIYDRWGSLVYRGEEWDGYAASSGVYVYAIKIEFPFQKTKVFYGTITVMN